MKPALQRQTMRLLDRALIGMLFLLVLLLLGIELARAGELVPAVGWSKATEENVGNGGAFGSLALRNGILPMLESEIGVAYRSEELDDAGTKMRMIPVTASLWLAPTPTFYVGGGVGMYHTTIEYSSGSGLAEESTQKLGTHLGGGLSFPIVPAVASLDFNGRYVFLDRETLALPSDMKADFWSVQAGVAFKIF